MSVFSETGQNREPSKVESSELALTKPAAPNFDAISAKITDSESAASPLEGASALLSKPANLPDPLTTTIVEPTVSPDELPARALYKNFNGLGIRKRFKARTDDTSQQDGLTNYALVNENEEQVEFVDVKNERYIRVTEERLQLHARSDAELTLAMAEVEAACRSGVLYLAKTIEERG